MRLLKQQIKKLLTPIIKFGIIHKCPSASFWKNWLISEILANDLTMVSPKKVN